MLGSDRATDQENPAESHRSASQARHDGPSRPNFLQQNETTERGDPD